ncbi:alpha/beta hydrolase [Inquilinus limosus]|uniref:alpha/beta fold hydrolase n=1 Tax=Inquilinus limosus TaxID=171674 RepID=UPI003F18F234
MMIRCLFLIAALTLAGAAPAPAAPEFHAGACGFTVPEGRAATCGTVTLPENRDKPDGATVTLAVAILTTPDKLGDAPPILYLEGGPGGAAGLDPDGIARWWDLIARNDWLQTRKLVLFDQRGMGRSEPNLTCPEMVDAQIQASGPEGDSTGEAAIAAARACRSRWEAEGHDLTRYTTADSARDVADLRLALGIDRWVLFGSSYGTRLALETARRYPEGIAAMILDGVYPPGKTLFTGSEEDDPDGDRSLRRVFAACAGDPACNAAYPDLAERYRTLLERLDDEPPTVTVERPDGNGEAALMFTGGLLSEVVFNDLYSRDDAATLPALIAGIDADHDEAYEEAARQWLAGLLDPTIANGAYDLAECLAPEAGDLRDAPGSTCPAWPAGPADDLAAQPVDSDIPALVLAGSLDPVTPPTWARSAAAHLPNGFLIERPDQGHGLIGSDPCAETLAGKFLDAPDRQPVDACQIEPDPLHFLVNG